MSTGGGGMGSVRFFLFGGISGYGITIQRHVAYTPIHEEDFEETQATTWRWCRL